MANKRFSLRVTFQVPVAVPLVIAARAFSLLFIFIASIREELKFVALVVGGTKAIYSAYYAGAASREQADHRHFANTFELVFPDAADHVSPRLHRSP